MNDDLPSYYFDDLAKHTIIRALVKFLNEADFTSYEENAAKGVITTLEWRQR